MQYLFRISGLVPCLIIRRGDAVGSPPFLPGGRTASQGRVIMRELSSAHWDPSTPQTADAAVSLTTSDPSLIYGAWIGSAGDRGCRNDLPVKTAFLAEEAIDIALTASLSQIRISGRKIKLRFHKTDLTKNKLCLSWYPWGPVLIPAHERTHGSAPPSWLQPPSRCSALPGWLWRYWPPTPAL